MRGIICEEEQEEWIVCKALASNSKWRPSELVRLGLEVLETGCKTWKCCRTLIRMGQSEYAKRNRTVPFKRAVEDALASRTHLRPATLTMFRQVIRRLMRKSDVKNKSVRTITPEYCKQILEKSFMTPRQRRKGRSVLSVVLTHSCKRGWCDLNVVEKVDVQYIKEQTVHPLSVPACEILLQICKELYDGSCLPAVGIMMFAGVRPTELERLTWDDINLAEQLIKISPTHSKTGVARHVSILPPLEHLLTTYAPAKACSRQLATQMA